MGDKILTINILNKTYRVKCPEGKGSILSLAADRVSKDMAKLMDGNGLSFTDAAVLSALNLSAESLDNINHNSEKTKNWDKTLQLLGNRAKKVLIDK